MPAIELQPGERDTWRVVQAYISLVRKWNARGQVTLRAGQTTTPVDLSVSAGATNVSLEDEIMLSPRTANAAAALTNVFVSSVVQGGFVLTHANAATVDRVYGWGVR